MRPDPLEVREMVLRTLTPVHVGTGTALRPRLDMIESHDGWTYVLDLERLIERVSDTERLTWALASDRPQQALAGLLERSKVKLESVSRHVLGGRWPRGELRLQTRSALGAPLLPGSSLKGALRTLALSVLLRADSALPSGHAGSLVERSLRRLGPRPDPSAAARALIEEPLLAAAHEAGAGLPASRRDRMRLFRCGDASFQPADLRIALLGTHSGRNGHRSGFLEAGVGAECLAEGARSRVRIGFDAGLLREAAGPLWDATPPLDWRRLAEASRSRARAIASREAARFRELGLDAAAARLEALGLDALHADAVVLPLGLGMGWEGATGGLLPEALRARVKAVPWRGGPTSRWAANGFPVSRRLVRTLWRPEGAHWQAEDDLALPLGWLVLEPPEGALEPPAETRGTPRPLPARETAAPPQRPARSEAPPPPSRPGRERDRRDTRDGRDRRDGRRRPHTPPEREARVAAPRRGDEVRAVVLEERTKKGALRFRIEGTEYEGTLAGQSERPPDDLAAGSVVKLRVEVVDVRGKNLAFRWLGRADETSSESQ